MQIDESTAVSTYGGGLDPGPSNFEAGDDDGLPTKLALHPPYPNPASSAAVIRFDLPEAGRVLINVYDVLGRRVQTLVNEEHEPGFFSAVLDTSVLPAGAYVVQMQVGAIRISTRMTVVR